VTAAFIVPLGHGEGVARLVVPGDTRAGRHANGLTRIKVRDARIVAAAGTRP
jgi:hypothetical protein